MGYRISFVDWRPKYTNVAEGNAYPKWGLYCQSARYYGFVYYNKWFGIQLEWRPRWHLILGIYDRDFGVLLSKRVF